MYLEVPCPSKLLYSIYIGQETQWINKQSFNLLYSSYMISERVMILWPNSYFVSALHVPREIDQWSLLKAAPQFCGGFYWFGCHCHSLIIMQHNWPMFNLLVMSSQPLEGAAVKYHLPNHASHHTSSHVALSSIEEAGRCSALSRTHWGSTDVGPSYRRCSTTVLKLRAPKVLMEIQICCCMIFLFTQSLIGAVSPYRSADTCTSTPPENEVFVVCRLYHNDNVYGQAIFIGVNVYLGDGTVLYLILVITSLMVRVSIVHHHLQDTATQQMLQTSISRLCSLRFERQSP
jgi:hypothetical protein